MKDKPDKENSLFLSSDEDRLREFIREIAGWVRWNEVVTGRLAIPLEIYERMKKALEDTK